jgi:hypothetical protein
MVALRKWGVPQIDLQSPRHPFAEEVLC